MSMYEKRRSKAAMPGTSHSLEVAGFSMAMATPARAAQEKSLMAQRTWRLPLLTRCWSASLKPGSPQRCSEESRSGGGNPGLPLLLRLAKLQEPQTNPSQIPAS